MPVNKTNMSSKISTFAAFTLALLATPYLALAQNPERVDGLITLISNSLARLVPILVGVAVLVFIWGLIRNLMSSNPERRAEGRRIMIWGIIAIFVIVSIWGIIEYIQDLLGIPDVTLPPPSPFPAN